MVTEQTMTQITLPLPLVVELPERSECGACVVVGHNAPDGVLPDAPIYRRQPRPEGCEDCSGCPDCYTNEKPCDCRDADEMITRPVSA